MSKTDARAISRITGQVMDEEFGLDANGLTHFIFSHANDANVVIETRPSEAQEGDANVHFG